MRYVILFLTSILGLAVIVSSVIIGTASASQLKLNKVTKATTTSGTTTYTNNGIKQNTKTFPENLLYQRGRPIYILLPRESRVVLSSLQVVASLPSGTMVPAADIANSTVRGNLGEALFLADKDAAMKKMMAAMDISHLAMLTGILLQ